MKLYEYERDVLAWVLSGSDQLTPHSDLPVLQALLEQTWDIGDAEQPSAPTRIADKEESHRDIELLSSLALIEPWLYTTNTRDLSILSFTLNPLPPAASPEAQFARDVVTSMFFAGLPTYRPEAAEVQ